MVKARLFLCLALGAFASIGRAGAAAYLEDISVKQDAVLIRTDSPIRYKSFLLPNPRRLIIQLFDTQNRFTRKSIQGSGLWLSRVRAAQYKKTPLVTRVVIDLKAEVPYSITREGKTLTVRLEGREEKPAPTQAKAQEATAPAAPQAPQTPPPAPPPQNPEKASAYLISAGDNLSLNVFPAEEFSRTLTVSPDGTIELPLIGALKAQGLSPSEFAQILRAKLAVFVADPQVTVNVRQYSGRRVAIIGEVKTPGYYEYRDGMKILDLISQAGGLGDEAKIKKIVILRKDNDKSGKMVVNVARLLKGDLSRDVELRPGDTVLVPRKRFTASAKWLQDNILPWATLMAIIASTLAVGGVI